MKKVIALTTLMMFLMLAGCGRENVQTVSKDTLTDIQREHYIAIINGAVPIDYKGKEYKSDLLSNPEGVYISLYLDSTAFTDEDSCKNAIAGIIQELMSKSIFPSIQAGDFTFKDGNVKRATGRVDNVRNIQSLENIYESIVITPADFTTQPTTSETATAESVATIARVTETTAMTNTPTASKQTTTQTNALTTALPGTTATVKTVYVTPTGKKYHYDGRCNGGKYTLDTLDNALKRGLEPCEKCVLK